MNTERSYYQVQGLDAAEKGMRSLAASTPGAIAQSLNSAAKDARLDLISDALHRYEVNEAGARHLTDLEQNVKASAGSLAAGLRIAKMRNDLGYFETAPSVPLPGLLWRLAPEEGFAGHVLRSTAMKTLPGEGRKSKAFLARFKSGHVGMVQRIIGSVSTQTRTGNGAPRWRNKLGMVEKVETLGSASAAAMINTVWPQRQEGVAEAFLSALDKYMEAGK